MILLITKRHGCYDNVIRRVRVNVFDVPIM